MPVGKVNHKPTDNYPWCSITVKGLGLLDILFDAIRTDSILFWHPRCLKPVLKGNLLKIISLLVICKTLK
jgi:hypothetical protein